MIRMSESAGAKWKFHSEIVLAQAGFNLFMRITGGQAAGRILTVPKGFDVRPTPDLVKQALFNSLGERVVGARVLELFAGTGALSLESLSRGAVHAVCVEKAHRHAQAIRKNLETAALPVGSLDVRVQDVFTALTQLAANGSLFDVVLADPPYGEKNVGHRSRSLAQRLLDDAHLTQVLSPGGVFVLGHTKRDMLEIPAVWHELKTLKHGDSVMRIFNRA
jgi:16S rRNA (guanine(966)-N(2))-methyltransferase RsmD